jgi:hypothetical protein
MNGNIKLILILIVVLVLFTFVTGANKGTEHFSTRKCNKEYKTYPGWGACPSRCSKIVPVANKQDGWKCK